MGGLRPPLLLKTRCTDAAGGSGHGVAVVRSWAELEEQAAALQPPAPTPTPTPSGSSPVQAAAPGAAAGAVPGAVAPVLAPAAEAAAFEPLVVQQYVPHTQALYKVRARVCAGACWAYYAETGKASSPAPAWRLVGDCCA